MTYLVEDFVVLSRKQRLRKHQERLGTRTPACIVCGEDDPRCLHLHHLLGKEFGNADVILCANHHTVCSDLQKDHPAKAADPRDPLERDGRLAHGVADLFEVLLPLLREQGVRLCAEAAERSPREKRDKVGGGAGGKSR